MIGSTPYARSDGTNPRRRLDTAATNSRLRWLSITPLGAPVALVVPVVYTSAATWYSDAACTGSGTRPVCKAPTIQAPKGESATVAAWRRPWAAVSGEVLDDALVDASPGALV